MRITRRVRHAAVAVLTVAALSVPAYMAVAQGPYGQVGMGAARPNIYRSDAPPVGSHLPDPSLANDYGSTFRGQNLDGVGLFRIDTPTGPGFYSCTTERVGPRTCSRPPTASPTHRRASSSRR